MSDEKQRHGIRARASEYERYDQVAKPDYQLAEAGGQEQVVDDFDLEVCDLRQWREGTGAERATFAARLGTAMEEIGFAVLTGHGVDPELFTRAHGDVRRFFESLPMESKLAHRAARHGSVSQGYFPVAGTSDIHPDLVEGWVFCRRAFGFEDDAHVPDFWPAPEFEARFRELVAAQWPLVQPIMGAILAHLGLDEHLFDARLEGTNFGLRLNYYPTLSPEELASGAGRLLGHEDVDLFTLLPAPEVEGLQALARDGRWVRLHAPPNSIVLNTGDYLQRLTNDRLPSTTHRVSPPRDPALRGTVRTSFPLAIYLGEDELLEVLPGLGEPRYEPIRVLTFHTRTTAKFYGDDYAVEA